MDWSAFIVVIIGTLLFFGFAVLMAIYSRRQASSKDGELNCETNVEN